MVLAQADVGLQRGFQGGLHPGAGGLGRAERGGGKPGGRQEAAALFDSLNNAGSIAK
jgi:hypothetical protein